MKMKTFYLTCGMAAMMFVIAPGYAQDTDDAKLQTEAQRIDKDKSAGTDAQKAERLAKQFNVPDSTVQSLRSQSQGWGEVTIGLSMAQKLATTDPKMYPTTADALNKIESLRTSGEGWGKIAKDLGFKLGPVISEVHRTHHELLETGHSEKGEKGHMERMEHQADHPEHPEHPDHPDRPERPGH